VADMTIFTRFQGILAIAFRTSCRSSTPIALASLLSACMSSIPATLTSSNVEQRNNSIARAAIQAAYDTLAVATMRGDVETAAAIYGADAINLRRNKPDLVGRDSIQASIAGWIASDEILGLEYHATDIEVRGDIATVRGGWTVHTRARNALKAPVANGRGKFVNLWKRDDHQRWRLSWDIGVGDVSAP
jgi:ketosteroid isomerase-like protein